MKPGRDLFAARLEEALAAVEIQSTASPVPLGITVDALTDPRATTSRAPTA
jgi:hypothetical protein